MNKRCSDNFDQWQQFYFEHYFFNQVAIFKETVGCPRNGFRKEKPGHYPADEPYKKRDSLDGLGTKTSLKHKPKHHDRNDWLDK
jgi:hypothetical protein